ncbi:MAG TPA: hypothetical protein VFI48_04175 [Hyphomicrobiaceae bacterium]|nr:hypothetical protein [Hyphomicrobiaceae bacterium]
MATLRLAVADGLAGTAQRRQDGGQFVLMAWLVTAQEKAAEAARAERMRRAKERLYPVPEGFTPRIYLPAARMTSGRTHVPYAHEPAAWG